MTLSPSGHRHPKPRSWCPDGESGIIAAVQYKSLSSMPDEIRVIKKYPNRRLYDTHISRYITLEEVRQLVLEHVPFQVEEKRSGQDITRSILLQVIADQEAGGEPIFSSGLLRDVIRLYGDPMQSSLRRYLELSMQLYLQRQQAFSDKLSELLGQAPQPVQTLKELADRQRPIWRTVRKEFLKSLSPKVMGELHGTHHLLGKDGRKRDSERKRKSAPSDQS